MAIAAMVKAWSIDRGWTIVAGIVFIFFAYLLFVLARTAVLRKGETRLATLVMIWFCCLLFMAWSILLTTCVFWDKPRPLEDLPLWQAPTQNQTALLASWQPDGDPEELRERKILSNNLRFDADQLEHEIYSVPG